MPVSPALVKQFFHLVKKRQFAESERTLEKLKAKLKKTEKNKGYLQALHGIFLASKTNNDQYLFLSKINLEDKDELEKHRREFLKQIKNQLNARYDQGFFSAWADYTWILLKNIKENEKLKQKKSNENIKPINSKRRITKKTKKTVQARL